MDIQETILDYLLHQHFAGREEQLPQPDDLLIGPYLDSVAVHSLIHFIEQRFEVRVEDEDLRPENFETITMVTAFVERKKRRGALG